MKIVKGNWDKLTQEDAILDRKVNEEFARKERKIVAANEIVENKDNVKKLVESLPATEAQKTAAKKDIDSGKAVNTLNEGEINREQGAPETPKQSFMSGLAMFLPAVLGGIGGAIVGGSAGAAEGIQGGMKGAEWGMNMQQSGEKHEADIAKTKAETDLLKMKKLGGGEQEAMQLTTFVEKGSGNPIVESGGELYLAGVRGADGKLVKADPKNLEVKDAAFERGIQNRFNLSQGKLSDTQIEKMASFNKALETSNLLKEMKSRVKLGIGGTQFKIGIAQEQALNKKGEYGAFRAKVQDLLSSYKLAMTGMASTDQESKDMLKVVPNVEDSDEVFMSKLSAFEDIIKNNKDTFLEAISTGQPLKGDVAKKLAETGRKFDNNQKQPQPSNEDDAAEKFLKENPNHPKADQIRKKLQLRGRNV